MPREPRKPIPDFECPNCDAGVFAGDIPDHLYGAAQSGKFDYECTCGCTFDVRVEWEPTFVVINSSVVRPAPAEALS